jgi:hypothetical protein
VIDEGQTAILEAAGLSGVCTDQHLTVLKAFGDTTAYLKNENFIFELSELLPDEVSVIVKAAAHQALGSDQRVMLSELNFAGSSVNILISPFFGETADRQLLILFTSNKRKAKDRSLMGKGSIQLLTRQHLASLEQELAEAKNNLGAASPVSSARNRRRRPSFPGNDDQVKSQH